MKCRFIVERRTPDSDWERVCVLDDEKDANAMLVHGPDSNPGGESASAGVAVGEYAGQRVLPAGAGGGAGALRDAGDRQHRSGQPVHQPGMDGTVGGGRHTLLNGRSWALHGQRVHRAAVAVVEVRGGVPARDDGTASRRAGRSPSG